MEAIYNNLKFRIENDSPETGAYLYVISGNKCTEDYLQDDTDSCKQFALETYGVPIDIWSDNEIVDSPANLQDSQDKLGYEY